jgi:2-polyprenyl-3-methyl-5-hydroxy-6-metoxy-1,4-benzoquinol methylase
MKPLEGLDIYDDAEFYDQEFAQRGHEIPFFVKQGRLAGGAVLEVACGTGRITLPIARTGVAITGLDVSRPMLELARRKAEAEGLAVKWLEQDCRQINTGQAFALVFSATNAMQHLQDVDSVNAFLTSAGNALRPGGRLVLDVFNPNPAKLARTAATRYYHKTVTDKDGHELRVEAASEYHSTRQILSFTLFYLRGNKLVRKKQISMRCFFPEELLALCQFNGLQVEERLGNYDESHFHNLSRNKS